MNDLSFQCPGCHHTISLTPEEHQDILLKLDSKYLARTVIVECPCHEYQVVIRIRMIKLFKD